MKTHLCQWCSQQHDLYYVQSTNVKHLMYRCPTLGKSVGLPLVEGLDIPIRESKSATKHAARTLFNKQQQGLDLFMEPKNEETVVEPTQKVTIRFDGGCAPTNPGNKYGSFSITLAGSIISERNRVQFGRGTSNEAEFNALNLALDSLSGYCDEHGIESSSICVHMLTDSTIVRGWIQRYDAAKAAKITEARRKVMAQHAAQCIERLQQFHSYDIEWNGRENNVAAFGH